MKKLTFALALVTLLTLCLGSFSVSAAAPIDAFTEVEPVPEENQINSTTWNHSVGVRQLTDPVGSWSWANTFEGKDSCWGMNRQFQYLDCDLKTIIIQYKDVDYSDKGATSVKELVFADGFTQSGLGEFGRIRATAETFEKMTVVYSNDGENWTKVDFTVAYHNESGTFLTEQNKEVPYDTFWHLIFTEEVPAAKYFALHTSESKAWDADDHAPRLAVLLDYQRIYLVKGTGDVAGDGDVTNAPETNAPETNAPETNAPETNAPETNAPETNAPETNAPETNAPETNGEGAADTADFAVASVALAAVAATGVVLCCKKRKN